jgi:hypothetical protein
VSGVREFSFVIGNCPGALVEVAEAFGQEHVNIDGIAGMTVLEEGVVGIVADDPGKARKILRDKGVKFEEREALVLDLPHHPGELATILGRLSSEGINVLSLYASFGRHQIVFTVDDVARAKSIFRMA